MLVVWLILGNPAINAMALKCWVGYRQPQPTRCISLVLLLGGTVTIFHILVAWIRLRDLTAAAIPAGMTVLMYLQPIARTYPFVISPDTSYLCSRVCHNRNM